MGKYFFFFMKGTFLIHFFKVNQLLYHRGAIIIQGLLKMINESTIPCHKNVHLEFKTIHLHQPEAVGCHQGLSC